MDAEAGRQNGYTTLDLVVMAVIGVVFAILNNVAGVFFQAITATMSPIVAQIFAIFGIAPCLAMFIVRKPRAAVITSVLNSRRRRCSANARCTKYPASGTFPSRDARSIPAARWTIPQPAS